MKGGSNSTVCKLVFLACVQEAHNLNFHSNINIMTIINHEYFMKLESIIYTCLIISLDGILNSGCFLSMEMFSVCKFLDKGLVENYTFARKITQVNR